MLSGTMSTSLEFMYSLAMLYILLHFMYRSSKQALSVRGSVIIADLQITILN